VGPPARARNARTSAYSAGQSPVSTCGARDDDVDLLRAAATGLHFLEPLCEGIETRGKSRRHAATGMPEPARAATAVGTRHIDADARL